MSIKRELLHAHAVGCNITSHNFHSVCSHWQLPHHIDALFHEAELNFLPSLHFCVTSASNFLSVRAKTVYYFIQKRKFSCYLLTLMFFQTCMLVFHVTQSNFLKILFSIQRFIMTITVDLKKVALTIYTFDAFIFMPTFKL